MQYLSRNFMHMSTMLPSGVPLALLPHFNCLLLSRLRKVPVEIPDAQTLTAVGHSCQAPTQDHCRMCVELRGYTGAHLISLTFNADKCTK